VKIPNVSRVSQVSKVNKNKIIFVLLFVVLGFVALQVPVNTLVGSRVKFTLFDLLAPISGAFLGTGLGVAAVFLMQLVNLLIHGFASFDKGAIIRLFPTLFAVWYFAFRPFDKAQGSEPAGKRILIVPLAAMIAFNLHPIGRTVWFYSLFWLIPILVWPYRERFLVLRSLGATFTAHAVGGAVWIWVFNLPAQVWISLIPVVIMERGIFALGISASYILMNNILAYLSSKKLIPAGINYDKKYLL